MLLEKLQTKFHDLQNKFVTIGIHETDGDQKKLIRTIGANVKLSKVKKRLKSAGVSVVGRLERHRIDQNLTVAQVANWNEFGTTSKKGKKKTPARSFIRATFNTNKQKIIDKAQKQLKEDPSIFYDVMGEYVLALIRKRIANSIPPANSPKTIAFKGSSTPLIDFGQLTNAITFSVNDK